MKVAITFNEPSPEYYQNNSDSKEIPLNFEPYFDLAYTNPYDGFKDMVTALKSSGYDAYTLNLNDDFRIFLKDYKLNKPDVIFNLVEIFHDKAYLEMSFASLLELMKIPFTGATPLSLGSCQRKTLAKSVLQSLGIRTPRYNLITDSAGISGINLRYPLIVKPAMEDASVGIENDSVVTDPESLKNRIEYVFTHYKQNALVEEFIDGRELNVSVFGDKSPKVFPISEIDFSNMPDHLYNIVSYQAKWDPYNEAYHSTIPVCPAELPFKITREAKAIALKAFQAMGCRDYARVDIRLSKDDQLFVLEVNPNPDLTEDAGFMRSSGAAGFSFEETLKRIVDFAWARRQKKVGRRITSSVSRY